MRKLHISDNEISKQAQMIFEPVLHGESAIALCYPRCKIAYNLTTFLQQPNLLKQYLGRHYKKNKFITVSLEAHETLESFMLKVFPKSPQISFIENCRSVIQKGEDLYFFILQADEPTQEATRCILSLLHSCILQLEKMGVMVFFETNVFNSPPLRNILQDNNKLLQNIIYFPLYSERERVIFLHNLAIDWNISVPTELIKSITAQFGGSLWLLREAVRCFKDYGYTHIGDISSTPGIKLRIQAILNEISSEDKEYLLRICTNQSQSIPNDILLYFSQIGLIERKQKKWHLAIPLLKSYLEESLAAQLLSVSEGRILFNNKDISSHFTPQEKSVLVALLNRKGTLVERDLIAKAVWKNEWEDRYSDWAIDKLISRLKITLQDIGIPKNTIQVKKGRGIQI